MSQTEEEEEEEEDDDYDSDSYMGSQDLPDDFNAEYKPSRALVCSTSNSSLVIAAKEATNIQAPFLYISNHHTCCVNFLPFSLNWSFILA